MIDLRTRTVDDIIKDALSEARRKNLKINRIKITLSNGYGQRSIITDCYIEDFKYNGKYSEYKIYDTMYNQCTKTFNIYI